jgi:acetyl-CoA synthetase
VRLLNALMYLTRPVGENATKTSDTMLIYFTSGTTGMPKMVHHDFFIPSWTYSYCKVLAVRGKRKAHMSVSDSGWAKFGWGKIYGQWICGAVIFAYDMDKFIPNNLLHMMEKYNSRHSALLRQCPVYAAGGSWEI